jgi:hypothetical protein
MHSSTAALNTEDFNACVPCSGECRWFTPGHAVELPAALHSLILICRLWILPEQEEHDIPGERYFAAVASLLHSAEGRK